MISAFQAVTTTKLKMVLAAGICAAVLGGCGGADSVAGKIIAGGQEPIEISPETFAPPVPCPPMQLKLNTYLIMKYVRGKENDPEGLLYQATLEEWANTCTQEADGKRRMKLGFSGDVTSGPAWKGGEVILPLRVAIMPGGSDAKPLVSEVLKIPVTVGAGSPSETWTLIENKFTVAPDQGVKVVFGFDDGGRR
ncbi:hypothetical protein [Labrenzia sp. 011]|uniref:hypothetical protein n=1 Tax=Labrenzia sp. 011 TaxID=2171494 RepID=UPI000D5125BE|nr:hypothetical protein [Labrenzia sp. 011]PVB63056.1 hypothetical protein DCO57_04060 [Labrenzia sp. 011]